MCVVICIPLSQLGDPLVRHNVQVATQKNGVPYPPLLPGNEQGDCITMIHAFIFSFFILMVKLFLVLHAHGGCPRVPPSGRHSGQLLIVSDSDMLRLVRASKLNNPAVCIIEQLIAVIIP